MLILFKSPAISKYFRGSDKHIIPIRCFIPISLDSLIFDDSKTGTTNISKYNYNVVSDIDTRDNSKIFVVKILNRLSKDEYINVNNCIQKSGGYYSKFKHGFIFRRDPSGILV